ncbi:MAG: hypothetical protein LKH33_06680 [Acetobacter sp.]|jgi:hypothetical protein|nr:hypothetical protein [Acetobacter sp.]MCH4060463.1 hypothetical protein [Acetobacter sp.]MCH4087403.1 hypothetical protein [Acetobacter sp.]MCI1293922.1 hypothetical protein [Acetobacter sp.]MCI1320484.1 hypothetical protein [Acetobacter sp.]
MSEELKSCPTCGGAEIGIRPGEFFGHDGFECFCWKCGEEGPLEDTEKLAREGWNELADNASQ